MTYDIQKVQAQLQCDILVCKTVSNNKHQYSFLGIIQSHNSETVRELKIGHVAKAQKTETKPSYAVQMYLFTSGNQQSYTHFQMCCFFAFCFPKVLVVVIPPSILLPG